MLLINSCSPRIVNKTSKTTIRHIDSTIIIPEKETVFHSRLPESADSIILIDRKTGVKLIIKEFINLDSILGFENIMPEPISTKGIQTVDRGSRVSYEFKIIETEQKIPILIKEEVIEKTKTISKTKTPWYYKLSFTLVIFGIATGLVIYLLKHFLP